MSERILSAQDYITQLEEENAILRREIEQSKDYIKHNAYCLTWIGKDCNCGLDALLAQETE